MGKQYKTLKDKDIEFIKNQKIFYIASSSGSEVNLSPKGYDTIRVLNESSLVFLSYPGSGNRTHRDAEANGEFTLVFNAFEGVPQIIRLFCKAEIVKYPSSEFNELHSLFNDGLGVTRDLFKFNIYAVESSCGMSVPIMEYKEDRAGIKDWARDMHRSEKLAEYMDKHQIPVDLAKVK